MARSTVSLLFLALCMVGVCWSLPQGEEDPIHEESMEDHHDYGHDDDFHPNDIFTHDQIDEINQTMYHGLFGLSVPQIIESYGYPAEIHQVTTSDGYILELHRIPHGRKCGAAENKKVAFLQHGLLCDSSMWITSGPEKSLAFLLADDCYDVWMGNARGNTYSKNHVVFDPKKDKNEFWAFSFHEMGVYDLPASIDHVLEQTGADGIYYTGHSMGTTMFFIGMMERPEYNSKIKLMNALAPVAFTTNMKSPLKLIAPFHKSIKWISETMGMNEFLPHNKFFDLMGRTMCAAKNPFKVMCHSTLFLVCGWNFDQVDPDILPIIMEHLPTGMSVRTFVHYGQRVFRKPFRKFDYGMIENKKRYGQITAPAYDLTKITSPVALYWGENDSLGVPKDTARLAELLPNLKKDHRIEHDRFNHLDFFIAKDVKPLVNDPVIEFMKTF